MSTSLCVATEIFKADITLRGSARETHSILASLLLRDATKEGIGNHASTQLKGIAVHGQIKI